MFQRLKKIAGYIFPKGNKIRLFMSFFTSGITIAINLAIPYVLNKAISLLQTKENYEVGRLKLSPVTLVGIYGGAWTLSRLLSIIQRIMINPMAMRSGRKLASKYLEHLMRLPLQYHITEEEGNKMEVLNKAFIGVYDLTSNVFIHALPTSLEVLSATILLEIFGIPLLGGGLGITLALSCLYSAAMSNVIADIKQQELKGNLDSYNKITSMVTNFETIHTHNNADLELTSVNNTLIDLAELSASALTRPDWIALGPLLLTGASILTISILVAEKVWSGEMSLDEFIFTTYYLFQFSAPLLNFSDAVTKIRASLVNVNHVLDFFEKHPVTYEDQRKPSLQVTSETATISFENVHFSYEEKSPEVLRGTTFNVNAREKLAIVGTSGSGKSSIVKILLGFYNVFEGTIKINGQDITAVNVPSLRKHISVVPQSSTLFNNTLRYNILYNFLSRENEVSEALLLDAIKKASLKEFLKDLPDGFDTVVGEKGAKMSGGQRQRVAIARALLKKPSLLIFDEATSALDGISEEEVQKSLDEAAKGITTLVITHNLKTTQNADRIIVLDKGVVVQTGTHDELLKQVNGVYRQLWDKKTSRSAESKEGKLESKTILNEPTDDLPTTRRLSAPQSISTPRTLSFNSSQLTLAPSHSRHVLSPSHSMQGSDTKDDKLLTSRTFSGSPHRDNTPSTSTRSDTGHSPSQHHKYPRSPFRSSARSPQASSKNDEAYSQPLLHSPRTSSSHAKSQKGPGVARQIDDKHSVNSPILDKHKKDGESSRENGHSSCIIS